MKKIILSSLAVLGVMGLGVCQAAQVMSNEKPTVVVIRGASASASATGGKAEVFVINNIPYKSNASVTALEGTHVFSNVNVIMFHGMTCPIKNMGTGTHVQRLEIFVSHASGKAECHAIVTNRPRP